MLLVLHLHLFAIASVVLHIAWCGAASWWVPVLALYSGLILRGFGGFSVRGARRWRGLVTLLYYGPIRLVGLIWLGTTVFVIVGLRGATASDIAMGLVSGALALACAAASLTFVAKDDDEAWGWR